MTQVEIPRRKVPETGNLHQLADLPFPEKRAPLRPVHQAQKVDGREGRRTREKERRRERKGARKREGGTAAEPGQITRDTDREREDAEDDTLTRAEKPKRIKE